jgi:hypothetical protein
MTHPASTRVGLVRLSDSDFVPQNPEDDLRGKDIYDPEGPAIHEQMLRAGAAEVLPKDVTFREVIAAVRRLGH